MKKDLPLLLQSIALGALSGIHQQATATPLALPSQATPEEAALRLKDLKATLAKPSFILKTIDGAGTFEGNFHRSHRSHSSHRSHYSSYSGSSSSYSSGSSSGSYSSGGSSTPSSSYSSGSSPSTYSPGNSPAKPLTTSPATKATTTVYRLGDRILYLGLTGSDVITLKNLLILKGYYVKSLSQTLTNEFDEDTRNAVKKLQQVNKLPEDGMVDPVVVAYLTNGVTTTPKPSLLGNRLLHWGLTGPDVIELKTKLSQKGYLKRTGDEYNDRFDDATEQAVKALQRANGLAVTGQVTNEVIKLLP